MARTLATPLPWSRAKARVAIAIVHGGAARGVAIHGVETHNVAAHGVAAQGVGAHSVVAHGGELQFFFEMLTSRYTQLQASLPPHERENMFVRERGNVFL